MPQYIIHVRHLDMSGIPLAPIILSWTLHMDSTREMSTCLIGWVVMKTDYVITINRYKGKNKWLYLKICTGKSYTPSDDGNNVTSENHDGAFPYQFLSRHVERQNQIKNSGRPRPLYLKSKPQPHGGWYAKKAPALPRQLFCLIISHFWLIKRLWILGSNKKMHCHSRKRAKYWCP